MPHSNILLAIGGATLLMNASRIFGSFRSISMACCSCGDLVCPRSALSFHNCSHEACWYGLFLTTEWILFRAEPMHVQIQSQLACTFAKLRPYKCGATQGAVWYGRCENHASKMELQPNAFESLGQRFTTRRVRRYAAVCFETSVRPFGVCGAATLLLSAKRV